MCSIPPITPSAPMPISPTAMYSRIQLASVAHEPDALGRIYSMTKVIVSVAALVLGARYLAVGARRPVLSIGRRAREHRLGLAAQPSPQHPRTAGRVRSRAPGLPGLVA